MRSGSNSYNQLEVLTEQNSILRTGNHVCKLATVLFKKKTKTGRVYKEALLLTISLKLHFAGDDPPVEARINTLETPINERIHVTPQKDTKDLNMSTSSRSLESALYKNVHLQKIF